MSMFSWIIFISLSRSGPIGQDEVEEKICTIFIEGFKANESNNLPRLEPLVAERGFIEKLKRGSMVSMSGNCL